MEKLPFTELGLSQELLKAVDKLGYEEASPIQTAIIPLARKGGDIVGQSATGSGKTAAFVLSILEKIVPSQRHPQALILCPTRELAVQVAEEVAKLSLFLKGIHSVPIYGGQSYDRQFRALSDGCQIIIGTPGRILDHLDRGTLSLQKIETLVLDEADRMLDMGFREDMETILSKAPDHRQLLCFSATMPKAIQDLIHRFARSPAFVTIEARARNAPQVDQVYYEVERRSKLDILTRLIDLYDFRFGIIFCSTKVMVDELDDHLHARGYATDRLHGDIAQSQRNRVMSKFKRRGFEFLVATDVAARGLDVDDLEVVFNYDLPNDAEDYTHRIGRTGRAGRSGKAITFVSGRELYQLQGMIRYGKLTIRREKVPSLDQVEEARENAFFEKLRHTLEEGVFQRRDRMLDRLLEQGYASTDIASALIHLMQEASLSSKPNPVEVSREFDEQPKEKKRPKDRKPSALSTPEGSVSESPRRHSKTALDRPPRGEAEKGYTTLHLNVGRKNLISPADIVGKIAGVTRLPANIVGAIDLHQRYSLVDIQTRHVETVLEKLTGIRVKGQVLQPRPAQSTPL